MKNSSLFFTSCLLVSLVSFIGCSEIKLNQIAPQSTSAESIGTFCTKDPDSMDSYVNYMFVMDISGSNSTTDPRKIRMAKMMDFYNQKKFDERTRWGAIQFDDRVEAVINEGDTSKPIFSDDLSITDPALQRLANQGPRSNTNYSGPLEMVAGAIEKDMENHPTRDDYYMIFFLSDGMPNSGDSSESGILRRVDTLVDTSPGRVILSTAFYGGQSSSLMKKMAERGGGIYQEIETEDLDFEDLIVGHTKEPWRLKNLLVYNLNSAICEDQGYGTDSDGDGVCDKDEIKYGLNSQKRYSLDDGYSDFFHWLVKTNQFSAGNLVPCVTDKRVDKDHDGLNECEESLMKNSNPSGTIKRSANPEDPDTDNDGILDGLEAFIFRNILGAPTNDRDVLIDWTGEGLTALMKIVQHRNPLMRDSSNGAYDTRFQFSHFNESGQACYSFTQKNLTLYPTLPTSVEGEAEYLQGHNALDNQVMLYFIQTRSTDPNGKGILMYDYQTLKADPNYTGSYGSAAGLRVDDSIFKSYIIPKEKP